MRERILGLEFEYPLIYEPAPGETAGPTQREIHDALVLALGEGACVPSLGRKGGVFLQNGSLLHFESIDPRGRQGLLEWATPECLHPLDLVAQSASQVLRLEEACPAALARLRAAGWRGALRVLRNNEDADGNAYGCHENYLVEDPAGVGLDALRALALALHRVLLLATTTPLILLLLTLAATLLAVWAALALGRALPRVDRHALRAATALGSLRDRLLGREDSWLHRFLFRYDRLLYWPVFALHVRAARRLLLGRYARHLTRFLATRTVYTGTGRVTWAGGAAGYTLSARAGRVGDAVGVYLDTEARPVLDVKEYLAYGGLGLFQRRKRLHVLAGDSNLCQTAEFLKVGATSLVIRLIEEGALQAAPPLADPAAAFRRVAADPACASPAEPGGPRPLWSALQWQRHYLDACRARFGDLGEEETDAVLGRWDEVLGHLERSGEAPSREALRRTVDWWAKKEMLDASLAGETSWEEIAPWGRLIESLEARAKPP
ncbi:MAG: proteasome accessory factor PafA2 family protein, partial [Planctomycetes bacterium]|nr:proteasome accessory factor PafA2 family protein [Planctomycetota bacterium]